MASKTRNWSVIAYPDSLPSNWLKIINDWHLPCAISPLHSPESDDNQEELKPHYHIVFNFDGPVQESYVKELITDSLNCTLPRKVISLRGYTRYLTHLDDPQKQQFIEKDGSYTIPTLIGGFDYNSIIEDNSMIYKMALVTAMTNHIHETKEASFAEFFDYCKNNNQDWYKLLFTDSYLIDKYIKSNLYTDRNLKHDTNLDVKIKQLENKRENIDKCNG